MSEVRLPPLRALDDFVLGSARLVAPDPCDPQRWCHRVINNLLYYQTNYLICFGLGLALAGYVRPLHTLLSALVVAVALGNQSLPSPELGPRDTSSPKLRVGDQSTIVNLKL
ncbi:hypothetical protein E5288_WYG013420 [Bos mutus]|uniref:PRA1 family protein n=1 Tax=Bos mutus TaxID=72004 RepID=A0A6B0SJA2_9CETA|nr:hypothetical protein [Bos mutus]